MDISYRNCYNYDLAEASLESGLECLDESKTDQSMKAEADINTLIKRFAVGEPKIFTGRVPMYGDFTEIGDFRSAMDAVASAESAFMQLPAEFRARLEHDPQRLLEFCANPDNKDEMIKYGLLKKEEPPLVPVPPA